MNMAGKASTPPLPHLAKVASLMLAFLVMHATGETNEGPKILFLHLQFKEKSVSLIRSSVRPGHLKPRPNPEETDGLHFEVKDAEGRQLWKGVMADPRWRRVEHEEPPGSGKLKSKRVELNDPEFTIRIPLLAEARQIEFYTLERTDAGKSRERRRLGKLQLPKK